MTETTTVRQQAYKIMLAALHVLSHTSKDDYLCMEPEDREKIDEYGKIVSDYHNQNYSKVATYPLQYN